MRRRKKVATTTSTLSLLTHRLARHVALLDHHLLREKDFFRRNFHAQVAAGDHDRVGRVQDGVEVLQPGDGKGGTGRGWGRD
jgi:predicted metallo-beta-lactamase superfamily hydrolase